MRKPKDKVSLHKKILSGRLFIGQAACSRQDNLQALARFSNPQEITSCLSVARQEGYGGLMTLGDERIVAALKQHRKNDPDFQVLPIIPNVPGYVREATEHGLVGAGIRRLLRVGPIGFAKVGLLGALQAPRVLQKDFPTLLSILYQLEMGEFGRFRPPAVFLHHSICDLALSFSNREFFESYAKLMRKRYDTEPALATSNFALLASKLEAWKIDIQIVAAPLNRENFLMPAGIDSYSPALKSGRFHLVADRISPKAPNSKESIEWAARQQGVDSVVVDQQFDAASQEKIPAASSLR